MHVPRISRGLSFRSDAFGNINLPFGKVRLSSSAGGADLFLILSMLSLLSQLEQSDDELKANLESILSQLLEYNLALRSESSISSNPTAAGGIQKMTKMIKMIAGLTSCCCL